MDNYDYDLYDYGAVSMQPQSGAPLVILMIISLLLSSSKFDNIAIIITIINIVTVPFIAEETSLANISSNFVNKFL